MKILAIQTLLFLPAIAFAADIGQPSDFKSLVALITDLIGVLVIFVFAITFLVFVWGIIQNWVINGGNETGVQQGKKLLVTSIVVLVIMFSIWGILNLLQASFFGG